MSIKEKLSDREKAFAPVLAAVSFVTGVWVGVWSVPDRALDVPLRESVRGAETFYSAVYVPVPPELPVMSVAVVFLSLWFCYLVYYKEDEETSEEVDEVVADD
jgi:hypothetical protein